MITMVLKTALLQKNIRQREIAEALGISRAAIAQYIAGKQRSHRFDEWISANLDINMDRLREEQRTMDLNTEATQSAGMIVQTHETI